MFELIGLGARTAVDGVSLANLTRSSFEAVGLGRFWRASVA
jgi:hypothetical protein